MPIQLKPKQLVMIGIAFFLVVVIGLVFFFNLRPKQNTTDRPKLTVWGTERSDIMNPLFAGYAAADVKYIFVDPVNYESQLLSALAAGAGPDVFLINDRDVPKWKAVIAPLPAPAAQQFTPLQVSQYFPDVVSQDFVADGQVYGLPLSIDTLAMAYNKDIFNSAGIPFPPKTWDDFDADVPKLRTLNAQNQVTQAAAAIGGSLASVPNGADILALLMLQNGAQMTDPGFSSAKFASGDKGLAAFNFYLSFANPASANYTWSDNQGDGFTNFVNGKVAIVFAYQSDLATIKAKAPFLNFGVAPVPQAQGASIAVNYPRYQGFVAAKAGQVEGAWNLILYLTVGSGSGKMYQTATGKPPALRTDVQSYANDPVLSVYASQILSAKSWYDPDQKKTDMIFDAAIKNVLNGAEEPLRALKEAETAVGQLMSRIQ